MATRALIRVIPRQEGLAYDQAHNHVEKAFFNIYRHWDGYPAGLGVDIAKICNNIKDKNVSEFAVEFVSVLEDTNRIELLAISDVDMGQEYIYILSSLKTIRLRSLYQFMTYGKTKLFL